MCALHQQRVRTEPSSQRDLSQSHQWLPLRVGGRDLRRLPLRRQHRKGQSRLGPCSPQIRVGHKTTRADPRRGGVSNYHHYGGGEIVTTRILKGSAVRRRSLAKEDNVGTRWGASGCLLIYIDDGVVRLYVCTQEGDRCWVDSKSIYSSRCHFGLRSPITHFPDYSAGLAVVGHDAPLAPAARTLAGRKHSPGPPL